MQKNEITINDEKLRKFNTEKIVNGIDNLGKGMNFLGSYAEDLKKKNQYNFYIGIITSLIILFFIGGVVVIGLLNGGIDGIFDTSAAGRRINCTNGIITDEVRLYQDAVNFKKVFGGNCTLYFK